MKTCGDCGMCCKLLQALDKAADTWCSHFKSGCSIYADRPPACAGFICLWLDSEKLDDAWRPDRAKFLMYTEKEGRRLNVIVDTAQPLAWKRELYYRRIVVFPHEDVDLGPVNPEHKIVSGCATHDGERVPFAMELSDADQPSAD